MKRYEIREDSGASKIITASSLDEALEIACDWVAGGEYDERVMVSVYVDEIDENGDVVPGEHASDEVAVGPFPKPESTECGDGDEDHDWVRPLDVVGGCRENPGVFSDGGTSMKFYSICSKCGIYKIERHSGSQRNPGALDESIEYRQADDSSLSWVENTLKK